VSEEKSAAEKLAAVFDANGVRGTLVIESLRGDRTYVHNPERASQRFSPASTFKIPNTLIGLKQGVVGAKDSPFEWDGTDRGVERWNRDQTLESAFRVSCVWCYQEIARDVGADAYVAALRDLNYGNREIGNEVDQFWLNGDLAISAWEQIEFLRGFVNEETGHSTAQVDLVKDIMLVEKTDDWSLHAKSGWTGQALHTGWYVGFVTTKDRTWLFAMNMNMDTASQAPLRHDVTVQALETLEITR
jgi:beta-lactamase class D